MTQLNISELRVRLKPFLEKVTQLIIDNPSIVYVRSGLKKIAHAEL